MRAQLLTIGIVLYAAGCTAPATQTPGPAGSERMTQLPTGARLDPAGRSFDVGSFPLAIALSPDGKSVVVLLNGWREQGIQILDRGTGTVTQTLAQPAAFLGLTFSPDGRKLYASGGNEDVVYEYDWQNGRATLAQPIALAEKEKGKPGTRYPAGVGVSPDGKQLYVAENLADSFAVVDASTRRVIRRFPTERYPYGVAVSKDGMIYVSAWGGSTVSVFRANGAGGVEADGTIKVGRHPSALALSADGTRLFVASASTDQIAIVDTRAKRVITTIEDPPPGGVHEGSTPNDLALSGDGRRLFVAEADNNAVAVFDLIQNNLLGRIPVGWYPSGVALGGDSLFVANGKGKGTAPNPRGPSPAHPQRENPTAFTLGQLSGTVTMLSANASAGDLDAFTRRVANANGWNAAGKARKYPPIEHVIYIIKENRTYDQILGDMKAGDGDTSLLFFPERVSPNHHALATRFGLFDRFFVNAEVSPDGHNWSTAAYTTDYLQKTVPSNYSDRGRSYDYEGTNRGVVPDDDAAEPGSGYLWNLAQAAGISFRNYGEFVENAEVKQGGVTTREYRGTKPFLRDHTNREFPGFDMNILDQRRADVWLAELATFEASGTMPKLEIIRLPSDHTVGLRAGGRTPFAHMADNDLALGRIIEALSRSRFWKTTAVFVLEDDAQNGSDHVDSHRSPLLVISPYSKGGVRHSFANTTDVLATIEELLGLGRMSQFDEHGRALRDIWSDTPDLRPYVALKPAQSLDERNPRTGAGARDSRKLALDKEDQADEDLFNRILWRAIKGDKRPWPGVTRMSTLEYQR
jgi:YVTN family beta-propeller protein